MPQINLRISDEEYQILEKIAKLENIPMTSLFRTIINKSFEDWKINKLFELYSISNGNYSTDFKESNSFQGHCKD